MLITDRKLCKAGSLINVIRKSARSGVKAVQLREKDLTSAELLALTRKIKGIKLIINDRIDIALLSGAYGIHSPEKGISASHVKRLFPAKAGINKTIKIGKSVHSLHQAVKAEKSAFDYLIFGPIFKTPSKTKYGLPQGLEKLKRVCESVNIPVYAVGGITPKRAKKCLNAGASGVAVISAIMKSKNTAKTVKEFKSAMGSL
jgi:thiamine-phosphate pyrophosphorylase